MPHYSTRIDRPPCVPVLSRRSSPPAFAGKACSFDHLIGPSSLFPFACPTLESMEDKSVDGSRAASWDMHRLIQLQDEDLANWRRGKNDTHTFSAHGV